jgi:hypothetical protein
MIATSRQTTISPHLREAAPYDPGQGSSMTEPVIRLFISSPSDVSAQRRHRTGVQQTYSVGGTFQPSP